MTTTRKVHRSSPSRAATITGICLAREYSRDSNQGLSEQDFGRSVAGACPSERQYYRVALLDYLTTQYPDIDAGAHLATANRAVEAAQKDIVIAFVKHRPPQK